MEARHSLFKSFKFAFDGLKLAFLKGRNFRIQVFLGASAVVFGLVFKLKTSEWLGLIFIISLVLILELLNTSLEAIVDLVSPEIREKAKIAKDVSAGAVFLASISAVLIGLLLFLPKITKLVWL